VNGSEPVIIESRGPVELFEPEAETDKTLRSAILKARATQRTRSCCRVPACVHDAPHVVGRGRPEGTGRAAASAVAALARQPSELHTSGWVLQASQKHYPSTGRIPDELLFNAPQYNLWIQCMYEPTQEKVLQYAKDAVDNGFPPGVIMIDTNW